MGIKAFSLIELMVVIAIVALLAAVAVPSYKSYIMKAKMAEISGLISAQQALWVGYYNTGTLAPAPAVGPLGTYITSATPVSAGGGYTYGSLIILFSTAAGGIDPTSFGTTTGTAITYGPSETNGIINWNATGICTVTTVGTGTVTPVAANTKALLGTMCP